MRTRLEEKQEVTATMDKISTSRISVGRDPELIEIKFLLPGRMETI
jgi:hypothetical protein